MCHLQKVLLPFFLFGLWLRYFLASLSNKTSEIVVIVYIIDVEVILCALIRRTQDLGTEHSTTCIRWFHEEMIVANQAEYLPVAIDTIVAEHLLDGDFSGISALVDNVLYEVSIASHSMVRGYGLLVIG
jgi:hypothetical protein